MRVLITGGMGFIGTNFVKYWSDKYPSDELFVLDALTYAARDPLTSKDKFHLIPCNIRKKNEVEMSIKVIDPDVIFHLAAESHVCRSIEGPKEFIYSNIIGTWNLIESCRKIWNGDKTKRFIHVSTDEVFGELDILDKPWTDQSPLKPNSPYAASKAASDMLVQSYVHTYDLPAIITNCTNNFGPNQHEEKLVPKTIMSILKKEIMTVYGSGHQIRDWIYVEDHCRALDLIFRKGQIGERYVIGGETELKNIDMIQTISKIFTDFDPAFELQIEHTQDRPTDDLRYAVNNEKLKSLGWSVSKEEFIQNVKNTVSWYMDQNSRDQFKASLSSRLPHSHDHEMM